MSSLWEQKCDERRTFLQGNVPGLRIPTQTFSLYLHLFDLTYLIPLPQPVKYLVFPSTWFSIPILLVGVR